VAVVVATVTLVQVAAVLVVLLWVGLEFQLRHSVLLEQVAQWVLLLVKVV
jgi:hypothetical protein